MNAQRKRRGLWLALACISLVLSVSGCEQMTSGNFGGTEMITGEASPPSSSETTAPTGVTAAPLSSSSISLSWSPVAEAASYKVYRSDNASGSYREAGTPTAPPYTDTGLASNTAYYYKVSAVNRAGEESPQSSSVSAKTSSPDGDSGNITYSSVSGGNWILQSDGRRRSPAIDHGRVTKAKISFTSVSSNASITIQLDVSSASWDFAFISQLDNPGATSNSGFYSGSRISGTASTTVTIPVSSPGNHAVYIGYSKDSSGSGGFDCAWFTVIDYTD